MKYKTKYSYLSFGELFQSLIDANDNKQCFVDMHDWNMVSAWEEQILFITTEMRNRGYLNEVEHAH